MDISVSLIGMPKTRINNKDVVFPYRKVQGLFYYLCVNKIVSRDEIVGIFWADSSEVSARKNVRDALYHLKKIIGNDVVRTEGNNKIELALDSYDFIDYHRITDDNITYTYNSDFLGFFYIKKCLEFENWVNDVRNSLLIRYKKAISRKIKECREEKNISELFDCGAKLLQRHIFEENMFREIMNGLSENGRYEDAALIYQKLGEALRMEMEDDPEEETRALYLKISDDSKTAGSKGDEYERDVLFCREKELRAILDECYLFRIGDVARSVLIVGEAGVGKSAIMQNIKNHVSDYNCFVFSYQCVREEQDLYLKPWRDIIKSISDVCSEHHIDLRGLNDMPGAHGDVALVASMYEFYAAGVISALEEGVERKGIIFFIDDIQWMDASSKNILKKMVAWGSSRNILFILSTRNDDNRSVYEFSNYLKNEGILHEISLSCFSLEETRIILRSVKPSLIQNNEMVSEIHKKTGGNAFFLFELLKEESPADSKLSKNSISVIEDRLVYLTGEERNLLDFISIFSRSATLNELGVLTKKWGIKVSDYLKQLELKHLISENNSFFETTYGFHHKIIQDYVYERIPSEKRKKLHRQYVEKFEEEYIKDREKNIDILPGLIYHFERCGDKFKAYTYHLEYLQAFYSVDHELYPSMLETRLYNPGLPPIGGEDELVALVEKIRDFQMKFPNADALRMRAEFLIGRYDLFSGSLKKGIENIHESINLAKKLNDRKCLLDNYLQIVFYAIQIHNIQLFDEYLKACEKLMKDGPFPDKDKYTVSRLRGVYHMKVNDRESALEVFKELIRVTEMEHGHDMAYKVGLAACYNYTGELHQGSGDLKEALSYYLKAISTSDVSNAYNSRGIFYANAGYVLYLQGMESQARIYIDNAIRCFEKCDALWGRAKVHAYAALLSIHGNDYQDARWHLDEAQKNAKLSGNPDVIKLLTEVEEQFSERFDSV